MSAHGQRLRDSSFSQTQTRVPSSVRGEVPPRPSCSYPAHAQSLPEGKRRNLVICIDGTSNQFGGKNTNVIELYHLLVKDKTQLTYYDSGIGTYAQPSWRSLSYWLQIIENKIDLGIAWNLERIIIHAYSWLSVTFEEGDIVYLFGFSRGAYQIRALSAMLEKVGLIHKGNEAQIPFAYELYADPRSSLPSKDRNGNPTTSRAQRFKETFSRNVRVHFVGAWDTVSSVGIIHSRTLPMTTEGMTHVCHFRHALALDERRVKFLPEYAHGGVTEKPQNANQLNGNEIHGNAGPSHLAPAEGDVKEVWFAGTHSDIGGGNTANEDLDRSGPPLSWMLNEAISFGLRVNDMAETSKRWKWEDTDGPHESLHGIWWFLEYMPVGRHTYKGQHLTTRRPHAGKGRKILPGQLIHGSLTFEKDYTPKASAWGPAGDRLKWEDLLKNRSLWLEKDLLGTALILASDIQNSMENDGQSREVDTTRLERLVDIVNSRGGRWTIGKAPGIAKSIEKIIVLISDNPDFRAIRDQLVDVFLDADGSVTKRITFDLVLPIAVSAHLDQCTKARHALKQFANTTVKPAWHDVDSPRGGKLRAADIENLCETGDLALVYTNDTIMSVVLAPDGKHIVSGSGDKSVRIWDVATGRCIHQLLGHTRLVHAVAVSPDGRFIASGSLDKTIRIWDLNTGTSVGRPLDRHTGDINTIVFSPDGKYIVSGSDASTVQIWDFTSEHFIAELVGHTDWVGSVAVSPDGQLVASASWDHTIRIWNLKAGASVGTPLKGSTGLAFSVAFSPDSKHIVSGSDDNIVRIWNVATERCVKQLLGHTNWAYCIAVSPDGKLIASGSRDNTIRIWDWETGASVGNPLIGHTDWVRSVAFSPDGQCIVSGSDDGTIRKWRLGALKIGSS